MHITEVHTLKQLSESGSGQLWDKEKRAVNHTGNLCRVNDAYPKAFLDIINPGYHQSNRWNLSSPAEGSRPIKVSNMLYTVESRYLEFCETRSIYLNQKYILIAFFNHNCWRLFYKSKLPEVQINLHFR